MDFARWVAVCAGVWLWSGAAWGQSPLPRPPIADPVEEPLLPPGISRRDVTLSGQLAYIFRESDGAHVVHVAGDSVVTLGKREGLELRSDEAVVWISSNTHGDLRYQQLFILLWGDGQVYEPGGTVTTGPVLVVTLNTIGGIETKIDAVAMQSSKDPRLYERGRAIRSAMAEADLADVEQRVAVEVFDVSGVREPGAPPRPRPALQVESEGQWRVEALPEGPWVLTITGGVYLSRGVPGSDAFLELRADSAVVFLSESEAPPTLPQGGEGQDGLGGISRNERVGEGEGVADQRTPRSPQDRDRQVLSAGFGDVSVEAAYLEGDVVLAQGVHTCRASRLYFDFLHDRALILDAVVHTKIVRRDVPLYLRAAEIRQLSRSRFAAEQAVLTTSEFHTPHYHVGAERVELDDLTLADPTGRVEGAGEGTFRIRHATLNIAGVPVAYWPYIQGSLGTSETAIRSIRTGFSDDFGVEFQTNWHTFHVLGLETPAGFDSTLSLDYFTERGPAIGVDADYRRDRYFGLLRSYLLMDDGEDELGRDRERPSPRDVRGRFLTRHRQYLEDDWQLTLELSYISDRTFLEEFFQSEFNEGKEQETLLYLKKQRENWALTALLQYRILNFETQTERLPDFGYFLVGESLAHRLPAAGVPASWYSENRVGIVRRRAADQRFREFLFEGPQPNSGSVLRADSRQELTGPVDVGPMRFVPFASIRGTGWDDTPESGGVARVLGTYGLYGSMYLWRAFPEVRSMLWDIDGIRHIIKVDMTAWAAHSNRDSSELFPFDPGVEQIDEVDGASVGIRQRWQTKRGEAEGEGGKRRTVDVLTLDVELGAFNDAPGAATTNGFTSFSRPEASIARNYVNTGLIWQINDATALHSEVNYDVNDGEVDIWNVAVSVERPPRFNYLLAYRFIEEANSNLLGFDLNYRLNEKHTLAVRELFDLGRGRTLDFTVALIRRFPRWFGAISFALDEAEDDFGVSISLWPEGLPQATLGSSRFSGVNRITRLGGY